MSGRSSDPLAHLLAGAVRGYQLTLRPVIGGHCRYWPSCSHYAIEALRTHGAMRGTALAARRVLRCTPWHAGGEDAVPAATPDCRVPSSFRTPS